MDKDRLRAIVQRLIVGRTNPEVAEGVGVTDSLVSHWRAGKRLPSSAALDRLLTFTAADTDTRREAFAAFHGLCASDLPARMGVEDHDGDPVEAK